MALCPGCSASYEDTFKFCPHCGLAKLEPPELINLNLQVVSAPYEEATLKVEVIGIMELTEPPFDWRPSGLTKLLGEGGRSWTQITTFRLLLHSFHPQKGQYVAYQSPQFRGFVDRLDNELRFPERFWHNESFHAWAKALFSTRTPPPFSSFASP